GVGRKQQAVENTPVRPQIEKPNDPDAIPSKGAGAVISALPRAIGFYLARVPLMLLNPIGAIRSGIRNQKHEAMGRIELIAFALPANLFITGVTAICTLIALLVRGAPI